MLDASLFDNMAAPPAAEPRSAPIDRLRPQSDLHAAVLGKLLDRLEFSERAMSELYPRWNYNEQSLQAYIRLDDKQERLRRANEAGKAPQVIDIVVPYAYASQEAMVTYISSVLFGRRPIFQLEAVAGSRVESAQNMEHMLQYNADRAGLMRQGFQYVWDSATYGHGTFLNPYVEEFGLRTSVKSLFGQVQRVREQKLVYSGNMPEALDPYKYFPDPRVPMSKVHTHGDFVFWRSYRSRLWVKDQETAGIYKWEKGITKTLPQLASVNASSTAADSQRNRRIGVPSSSLTRGETSRQASIEDFVQIDQGTVRLIPKQWGLGDGESSELWLFVIGNKSQILLAQPLGMDHGQAPTTTTEPWSFGYEFGSLAAADFLIPFQETLSWLINSRMHNVRATVNNMFLVDPSRVEVQDIERAGPGKIIRMKKAFYGSDVRMAITQLPVTDVTQSNLTDMQVMQRIADQVLGINDNLRGTVNTGGRKSATEARLSMESGAGRMGHKSRHISSESLIVLGQQMSQNIQQYMPDEMAINVLGADGTAKSMNLTPDMVVGDFNFRVNDGSLPYDKTALLEVYKELFLGIAQDPELRQMYSLTALFDFIGELGGARNLERFKRQTTPAPVQMNVSADSDENIARGVASGQLGPLPIPPRTFS